MRLFLLVCLFCSSVAVASRAQSDSTGLTPFFTDPEVSEAMTFLESLSPEERRLVLTGDIYTLSAAGFAKEVIKELAKEAAKEVAKEAAREAVKQSKEWGPGGTIEKMVKEGQAVHPMKAPGDITAEPSFDLIETR